MMSQEMQRLEQSFGGNEHLLKRLTMFDFDADMASPIMPKLGAQSQADSFEDRIEHNSGAYHGRQVPKKFTKIVLVNGPGLDPEPIRLPSTTVMTSTLFRSKAFKDMLK